MVDEYKTRWKHEILNPFEPLKMPNNFCIGKKGVEGPTGLTVNVKNKCERAQLQQTALGLKPKCGCFVKLPLMNHYY